MSCPQPTHSASQSELRNQILSKNKLNIHLLLFGRKNRKFKSTSNPLYYSRSTLTPELR